MENILTFKIHEKLNAYYCYKKFEEAVFGLKNSIIFLSKILKTTFRKDYYNNHENYALYVVKYRYKKRTK